MLATTLMAVAGTFGIGMIIGIVVLMTAEEALLAVAKSAARDVSGSFWAGVLAQLLAVPALVILLIACAVTIIGILAIPIAALAWALALAGAVTLGVLAVSMVIGRAIAGRGAGSTERSAALRGLTVGLLVLSLVWFGAALASGTPLVGAIARLAAVAFTWAVATVGLGAVVKSRIGVSRISMQFGRFGGAKMGGFPGNWAASSSTGVNEVQVPVSWQTPTPIQGVVAAPRPTDASSSTHRPDAPR
ncbi:hypothetical protein [Gemmatimonas sp.]|jgi:hypothetical protein|uniref:hypothetical protein n=1 Tax=Gemmatimonas sp. TaxID=1962908 RepID=UPI0031BDB4E4|nr:hypothetical protein [Gemmatimonas sp.]